MKAILALFLFGIVAASAQKLPTEFPTELPPWIDPNSPLPFDPAYWQNMNFSGTDFKLLLQQEGLKLANQYLISFQDTAKLEQMSEFMGNLLGSFSIPVGQLPTIPMAQSILEERDEQETQELEPAEQQSGLLSGVLSGILSGALPPLPASGANPLPQTGLPNPLPQTGLPEGLPLPQTGLPVSGSGVLSNTGVLPDTGILSNGLPNPSGPKLPVENQLLGQYDLPGFKGFSAILSPQLLSLVLGHPLISRVESDAKVSISSAGVGGGVGKVIEDETLLNKRQGQCSQQSLNNYGQLGLDRIDENSAVNLDGRFDYYTNGGSGVNVYVIDTGYQYNHDEFTSGSNPSKKRNQVRTYPILANFAGDNINTDCNGHGTHVAGIVGGATAGVARSSTILAVKVLDCNGNGLISSVLSGLVFAYKHALNEENNAVFLLSFSAPYSLILNQVVAQITKDGFTVVTGAGNTATDACLTSPASAAGWLEANDGVLAVGASGIYGGGARSHEQYDARTEFSNFGRCVSLFAPGEYIYSATSVGGLLKKDATQAERDAITNRYDTMSGTSQAAAFVAGAAAVILADNPSYSPAQVKGAIQTLSYNDNVWLDCDDGLNNSGPLAFFENLAEYLRYLSCPATTTDLLHLPCNYVSPSPSSGGPGPQPPTSFIP